MRFGTRDDSVGLDTHRNFIYYVSQPMAGTTGGLLRLAYDRRHIAKGVHASITVGVDPDETHDGTDDGGQPGPSASASASS